MGNRLLGAYLAGTVEEDVFREKSEALKREGADVGRSLEEAGRRDPSRHDNPAIGTPTKDQNEPYGVASMDWPYSLISCPAIFACGNNGLGEWPTFEPLLVAFVDAVLQKDSHSATTGRPAATSA
jgi:hypothetical protein